MIGGLEEWEDGKNIYNIYIYNKNGKIKKKQWQICYFCYFVFVSIFIFPLNNLFLFYIHIPVPPPSPYPHPSIPQRKWDLLWGVTKVCHITGGRAKGLFHVSRLSKISIHRERAKKASSCTRDECWFHSQWSPNLPKSYNCPHIQRD